MSIFRLKESLFSVTEEIIDELRFDCGNVLGYLEANIAFALHDEKVSEDVKKMLKKLDSKKLKFFKKILF